MEYPAVIEKPDAQTRTFRFCYFRAQSREKSLNISPADTPADRTLKNELQGFLMLRFHKAMIFLFDITSIPLDTSHRFRQSELPN